MSRPKYNQLIIRDFTKGLYLNKPDRSYDLQETPEVWNVAFYPEGALTKRTGYKLKMAAGTTMDGSGSPVRRIEQLFTSDGNTYLVGFTAGSGTTSGSVYHWNSSSSTWTHMATSLYAGVNWDPAYDDVIQTEIFTDKAIATMGTSQSPIYWEADENSWEILPVSGGSSSYVYVTGGTMPVGVTGCVPCNSLKGFRNYLFMGGTYEDGVLHNSRVRWSALENPYQWNYEDYIDLDPYDGDFIVAMEVLGDKLIVFKERKIYSISYVGGIYLFVHEIEIDGRGCIAPQSITSIYDDLIFLAQDGIYSYTGAFEEKSRKIKDAMLNINPTNMHLVEAAPLEEYNQIWFIAPSADSLLNNVAFVYDHSQDNWTVHSIDLSSLGFYYVSDDLTLGDLTDPWDSYDMAWDSRFSLANTPLMICGTYDGLIGDMGFATADGASGDIDSSFKTAWFDFDDPNRTKRLIRLTFYVASEASSTYGLNWYLRKDWDSEGTPVASGVLPLSGQDYGVMLEDRIDISEQGRSFQIEIANDQAYQSWRLYEIRVDYMVKGTVPTNATNVIQPT